jgi:hypothetical protein
VRALAALVEAKGEDTGGEAEKHFDEFCAAVKVPGRPNHEYTAVQLLQMQTEADPPLILSHPAIQVMLAFLRRVAGVSLFEWDALHAELGLLPHAAPLEIILQKGWLDRQKGAAGGHTSVAAAHVSDSHDVLMHARQAGGILSEYAAAHILLAKQKLDQPAIASPEASPAPTVSYKTLPTRDEARAAERALIEEQEQVSLEIRQRRKEQREREAQKAAAATVASISPAAPPSGPIPLPPLQSAPLSPLQWHVPESPSPDYSTMEAVQYREDRKPSLVIDAARPARQFSLAFENVDNELYDEIITSSRPVRAPVTHEPLPDANVLEGMLVQLSRGPPAASLGDRSGSVAEW